MSSLDPAFVLRGWSTVFKGTEIFFNRRAEAGFERALDIVEAEGGEINAASLDQAMKAGKSARAADYANKAGTAIDCAKAGYDEFALANKQGGCVAKTVVRTGARVGTEFLVKKALAPHPVIAALDEGTGKNFSNSIMQVVRVPLVVSGSVAEQEAYVRSVKNGEYSPVVKGAFNLGEVLPFEDVTREDIRRTGTIWSWLLPGVCFTEWVTR
jgi:hypothetical protein